MNTHIFVCKKCGSIDLNTQEKGSQIGLYCSDCGAWIKWIGKEELFIFNKQKSNMNIKITDTRKTALDLINKERDRQDLKWGEQNHEQPLWVGILGEEFGEYCQAVNETVFDNGPTERLKGGYDNIIKELTHVAAVAVGAIECLMRGENNVE